MNLHDISLEIKETLEEKRKEFQLSFIEEDHIYYMKDLDGNLKCDFPSVSTLYQNFYKKFDDVGKALEMCHGDVNKQQSLLKKWKESANYSTNLGSRVHYELERELIKRYSDYKEVRKPIFEIDYEQKQKSDKMIIAGNNFIDLMHDRGAVLLDTEIVMGHPKEQYVGQPDKAWLMMNSKKTDYGFVITDWKSNQPKNFEVKSYTTKMYSPFEELYDNALGHYTLQLPFYGRLLLSMLENTKFSDKKLLGCVIVLLKENGTFVEFKVPQEIKNTILTMDLLKYLKK